VIKQRSCGKRKAYGSDEPGSNVEHSNTQTAIGTDGERFFAVENDGALQKVKGLFSSEAHAVDTAPDGKADLKTLVTSGLPLVIVSANSKLADKVLLLEMGDDEMGSDDCVAIPLASRNLSRVCACWRDMRLVFVRKAYMFLMMWQWTSPKPRSHVAE
jgi:hypothetical protein